LIKNKESLIQNNNNSKSTRLLLKAIEKSFQSIDPYKLIARSVNITNQIMRIESLNSNPIDLDLNKFKGVYIIGAGKATAKMAKSLSDILGTKVYGGAITVPYNTKVEKMNIQITKAAHPLPDNNAINGTNKIIEIIKKSKFNDLIFVLISGGASALLPMPYKGITIDQKQEITSNLLSAGASIVELNVVRKHLSSVKGGRLAERFHNRKVVTLILSDVVSDQLDTIGSGPTVGDSSSYFDAKKVLCKYKLWFNEDVVPNSIRKIINRGILGEISETPNPSDAIFRRISNLLIGNNHMACKEAKLFLNSKGIKSMHLGSGFTGTAKDFGVFLASLTKFMPECVPYAFILGGETTVKLNTGKNGIGGRNQEAALTAALNIRNWQNLDFTIACLGTDGIDGNSHAAGAIVTPKFLSRISRKRRRINEYINLHDSNSLFTEFGNSIITNRTGTNVNDLAIVCRIT
jgi:glycerate-2-kinase